MKRRKRMPKQRDPFWRERHALGARTIPSKKRYDRKRDKREQRRDGGASDIRLAI